MTDSFQRQGREINASLNIISCFLICKNFLKNNLVEVEELETPGLVIF